MLEHRYLALGVIAAAVCMVYPHPGSACDGVEVLTDGSCEQTGDSLEFRIDLSDASLDEYTVEWGAHVDGLELNCDPPDDVRCLQATLPCPDCGTADAPEQFSVWVEIYTTDDRRYCFAIREFETCAGEDGTGRSTSSMTTCSVRGDTRGGLGRGPLLGCGALLLALLGGRRARGRESTRSHARSWFEIGIEVGIEIVIEVVTRDRDLDRDPSSVIRVP